MSLHYFIMTVIISVFFSISDPGQCIFDLMRQTGMTTEQERRFILLFDRYHHNAKHSEATWYSKFILTIRYSFQNVPAAKIPISHHESNMIMLDIQPYLVANDIAFSHMTLGLVLSHVTAYLCPAAYRNVNCGWKTDFVEDNTCVKKVNFVP